ncbi:GDSL-type esterase/lipase family protein [Cyanobium gracile]|uniref:GDSL-type esterase/lipase family protein n=1 Tax=Cyanobium gracile UHCC 0281 TaxID=3110309 RepID=A0ABU5SWW8_9CYAN|nr:GDSL-type esterase/lipase family protein [Cyanobium gracile]MEA5442993.1 GDSL-type esterase/lipase family protein [Cyanobium gracile UHCC 0281]
MPSLSWVRIGGLVAVPLTLLMLGWGLRSEPGALPPESSGSPSSRGGGVVTFVGDSLTAQGNWQAAFPAHVVHNQGVSGDTSVQLMARLPSIRQTGAATYLVMVGINDIVWGYDPGRIAGRIQWLRTGLQIGTGARVIVQSTIPCARFRCGADGVRRVAELNQRLAQQTPARDYVDLTTVMADADGLKRAYTVDGVHLNAAGYARWQARLRELGLP